MSKESAEPSRSPEDERTGVPLLSASYTDSQSGHPQPPSHVDPDCGSRYSELPGTAQPHNLADRSLDGGMHNLYIATSDSDHIGMGYQNQQGYMYSSGHHQPVKGSMSYPPSQGIYPGISTQWAQGHHDHHPSAGLNRPPSWSPPQTGPPIPQPSMHGSASVSQIHRPNNKARRTLIVGSQPLPSPITTSFSSVSVHRTAGNEPVPQGRQNDFDQFIPEAPIMFPLRSGGEGISLDNALAENFDHLIGRDDPMFENYTAPAISLHLEWPGYKPWVKQIKSKDWRREPEPITRAKLAVEVAKKAQNFIQDNINEPTTPESQRWKVGPGLIEVKDLVLVSLVHVSKGSWQPEFRVLA